LRVTGLTAGFDIAGFITIVTAVFAYVFLSNTYKKRYLVLMILSVCMTLFTSRGNMIYLSILFLVMLRSYMVKSTISLKKLIFLFMIFIVAAFFMFKLILPVFSQTVNSDLFEYGKSSKLNFVLSSYGHTDLIKMLKSFIILPESYAGLVFGASIMPQSDSGYIQTINAIGLVGLFITLAFYWQTYKNIKYFYKNIKDEITYSTISKVFLNTALILFLLSIIASVKNQYFFTRSVFEMFIFCSFVMEFIYRQSQSQKIVPLND
jgi:hypothetical protein